MRKTFDDALRGNEPRNVAYNREDMRRGWDLAWRALTIDQQENEMDDALTDEQWKAIKHADTVASFQLERAIAHVKASYSGEPQQVQQFYINVHAQCQAFAYHGKVTSQAGLE
jgi:hypothetical protein